MNSIKFNFETNNNQHYMKKIDISLILHIEKMDESIDNAIIYFTDYSYQKLNIPNEIILYDNENNIINIDSNNEIISISWCKSFTITYKNNIILNVSPLHIWNIIG